MEPDKIDGENLGQRVLVAPEDICVGQFLCVHTGAPMLCQKFIPGGIVVQNEYELCGDVKGFPIAVLAVNLPFMLGAFVHSGLLKMFDVRDIQFMRVSKQYVETFRNLTKQHVAEPEPVGPGESERTKPAGDGGGVTADIS